MVLSGLFSFFSPYCSSIRFDYGNIRCNSANDIMLSDLVTSWILINSTKEGSQIDEMAVRTDEPKSSEGRQRGKKKYP